MLRFLYILEYKLCDSRYLHPGHCLLLSSPSDFLSTCSVGAIGLFLDRRPMTCQIFPCGWSWCNRVGLQPVFVFSSITPDIKRSWFHVPGCGHLLLKQIVLSLFISGSFCSHQHKKQSCCCAQHNAYMSWKLLCFQRWIWFFAANNLFL